MMIHMKPGAKKHILFQPNGPGMVYILWNLLCQNKAVISRQARKISIMDIHNSIMNIHDP